VDRKREESFLRYRARLQPTHEEEIKLSPKEGRSRRQERRKPGDGGEKKRQNSGPANHEKKTKKKMDAGAFIKIIGGVREERKGQKAERRNN